MTGSGIAAYGSHVPFWRLTGATVAAALGKRGSPASRAVASYDQDTTTLAVEAARIALHGAPAGTAEAIDALAFATATPVYADKTNATAIHAALSLPGRVRVQRRRGIQPRRHRGTDRRPAVAGAHPGRGERRQHGPGGLGARRRMVTRPPRSSRVNRTT